MIYLELFFTFLQIGTVSFGGGYGMISLIREQVLSRNWLSETDFLNMIAVSESTPGPIAVNMATFIGASQGGLPGSVAATLGVVLPSFIIILLIAALIRNLLKYKGVQAFLSGIRPCVTGLILATATLLFFNTFLGIQQLHSPFSIDVRAFAILTVLLILQHRKKAKNPKGIPPIGLISISACLGIILYSF
ncbi:MAG: chromate transporter [Lachnospiraceae bacterium]|nr:chromate transporter [Lachnospiraceae bacterium]MBP3611427.1 chromate transporter [Lachnospiraceae bacterium]